MTSDLVITKKETDQIVFRLDVINQSISDVNSLQQNRIKMAEIKDGLLTFIMIDVKPIDAGYYVNKQYNDVITEQQLVVLGLLKTYFCKMCWLLTCMGLIVCHGIDNFI